MCPMRYNTNGVACYSPGRSPGNGMVIIVKPLRGVRVAFFMAGAMLSRVRCRGVEPSATPRKRPSCLETPRNYPGSVMEGRSSGGWQTTRAEAQRYNNGRAGQKPGGESAWVADAVREKLDACAQRRWPKRGKMFLPANRGGIRS